MSTPSRFLRGTRALLAAAKSTASAPKPPKALDSAPAIAPKKKRVASELGIMKPLPVSLALQSFVGAPEVSRGEAVKIVWAHIKENNLQNPSNKKEIFCDAKLKNLFDGKDKVGFLEIAKLLSPHFIKSAN